MRLNTAGWLHRLTLGQKFLISFGLLLVLLGLSLLAILFYLSRINSYVERHTRITVPAIRTAADMRQQVFDMNLALAALTILHAPKQQAEFMERIAEGEPTLRNAVETYRRTHAARTHPILFRMLTEHHRVDLADQEDGTLLQITALLGILAFKSNSLTQLLHHNGLDGGPLLKELGELNGRLIDAVTVLMDVHTKIDAEMKAEGNSLLSQARLVILALVILLALVIASTYAMVTSQITRPLSRLASTADRITHHDLTAGFDPWPAKDEVGILASSLSAMLATLRERTQALGRKTKELESFTYSVAHDLKAPLREIEGFSSLLLTRLAGAVTGDRTQDETAHHYAHVIHVSALRMAALIDDLLRYSRLEQQVMPKSRVHVRTLLDSIVGEVAQPRSPATHISIDLPFADVWGDPISIRQALLNLVDNAVKFSEGSHPSRIMIGGAIWDGQHVLSVQDNGIGFAPKDAERIFGLFERLNGPEEYEGTGAGLAIVKLVMEKHGGQVRAESSPGNGSTFYLVFPEP